MGSPEQSLASLAAKYGKRLTRKQTDHYDVVINAYTVTAEPPGGGDLVLTYFAPNGIVTSIVATATKYAYRVDIGRPEGRWW